MPILSMGVLCPNNILKHQKLIELNHFVIGTQCLMRFSETLKQGDDD